MMSNPTAQMQSALVVGLVIPSIVLAELTFIFVCSSYVYWVEIQQINCCFFFSHYLSSNKTKTTKQITDTNSKDDNQHIEPSSPSKHKVKSSYETRAGRLHKKSVLMISLCSFFAFIGVLGVIVLHSFGFQDISNLDPIWCEKVIPKAYSIAYILSNVSLYQFLNARSELAKTAADESVGFRRVRLITTLLANCASVAAILNIFLWAGRVVEVDGRKYCVDSPSWQVNVIFLVVTTFVSVIYLILFLWPLLAHYRDLEEVKSENSIAIMNVVKKNLILSVTALGFTVIAQCFFLVTILMYHGEPHINVYAVALAVIDIGVSNLCICLMTKGWLPKQLKKYLSSEESRLKSKNMSGAISPVQSEENRSVNIGNTTNSLPIVNMRAIHSDPVVESVP